MRDCVYGVLEHFIAQLSNQRIGNHPDIHISCPTVKIVFFPNLHSGSFQTPFCAVCGWRDLVYLCWLEMCMGVDVVGAWVAIPSTPVATLIIPQPI